MKSTQQKIEELEDMLEGNDLNDIEFNFVSDMASYRKAKQLDRLSDKQTDWIDRLHARHFGGRQ